jgi:hypothetical protein
MLPRDDKIISLTLQERFVVEGVALDVVVVVALLYFGRYWMPVVGQLDFDPSMAIVNYVQERS